MAEHLPKPDALKNASEGGNRRDISILTTATGWDGRALALAAAAYENAEALNVPAEALYGLYRAGIPTDTKTLARLDRGVVEAALRKTAQAGIVDSRVAAEGVEAFTVLAARERLNFVPAGKLAGLGQFIRKAPVSADDAAKFQKVAEQDRDEAPWAAAEPRASQRRA